VNSITLTGRLTAEPQKRSAGETEVCDMRIAVQRRRGRNGEDRGAVFIDVSTFGAQAQSCAQYLHKGKRVGVHGRLELDEWEAEGGGTRRRHKVVADQVEFLDPPASANTPAPSAAPAEQPLHAA
jgi:single-strand DNA-binding protein